MNKSNSFRPGGMWEFRGMPSVHLLGKTKIIVEEDGKTSERAEKDVRQARRRKRGTSEERAGASDFEKERAFGTPEESLE